MRPGEIPIVDFTRLNLELSVTARVLRDKTWHAVPARELVTGDVVRVRPPGS